MSLINEALKRAEAEKHGSTLAGASEAPLPPARPPGSRRSVPLIVLLVAITSLGGLVAWLALDTNAWPGGPEPAQADAPAPLRPQSKERSDPEVELAFAKTLDALEYYQPPPAPPAKAALAAPSKVEDPGRPIFDGKDGAKPKPQTQVARKPRRSPDFYKVSAILRGSDGATAIINGKFVNVGDTVDDAKVVKIDRHTVELELDGHRFTIQM